MSTLPHIAQHAPLIPTGVSYMTAFISSLVSIAAGFGLGWYVKGRGMAGVKIDLANVKTDVENLKAKVTSVAQAPAPAAFVAA